jgi:hypothetical protein
MECVYGSESKGFNINEKLSVHWCQPDYQTRKVDVHKQGFIEVIICLLSNKTKGLCVQNRGALAS